MFIGDVRRSNREFQKGWGENEISEGEGRLAKWNSEGMEGGGFEHFGISKGRGGGGGGKMMMPPMVGYRYFLESPNLIWLYWTGTNNEALYI